MTQEEFEAALAEAWDRGFSAGEAFGCAASDNKTNPYRRLAATTRSHEDRR